MFEFDDEQYEENNTFEIKSKIFDVSISLDDIDRILDNYIDGQETEDDKQNIVIYVLQLFYRSGKIIASTDDIIEKINLLIADRVLDLLQSADLVEEHFDVNKNEYVYTLKKENNDNL